MYPDILGNSIVFVVIVLQLANTHNCTDYLFLRHLIGIIGSEENLQLLKLENRINDKLQMRGKLIITIVIKWWIIWKFMRLRIGNLMPSVTTKKSGVSVFTASETDHVYHFKIIRLVYLRSEEGNLFNLSRWANSKT